MKLTFGKHKGKEVSDVPDSYLAFLATYNSQEPEYKKLGDFVVPKEIEMEAERILGTIKYAKNRLGGMPSEKTDYIIEGLGDLEIEKNFDSLDLALSFLKEYHRYPDPEDDRILVWEILPSGHKKVVWHFSGWHWNADEFWKLDQGTYPGDKKSAYAMSMDDYDGTTEMASGIPDQE